MNHHSNDPGVVVVSPDTNNQFAARAAAPRWPLALSGLLLAALGVTGWLAWNQWSYRAQLQADLTKAKQSKAIKPSTKKTPKSKNCSISKCKPNTTRPQP